MSSTTLVASGKERADVLRVWAAMVRHACVLGWCPGDGQCPVTEQDVAGRIPDPYRVRVRHFASRASELRNILTRIENYRMITNDPYWETRCQVEQSEETAQAPLFMMLGAVAAEGGDPDQAREQFELAWNEWERVFLAYND